MSYQIYSISQRSQLFFTRVQQRNNYYYSQNPAILTNINSLSLIKKIPNILQMIPRQFTISTKNSSSKFNIDFLIETCSTISSFIKEIPHNLEYHLDIDDQRNVLGKFEQLFLGQKVIFEEEDLPTCQEITDKLFLVCCPNYMKPEHLRCSERGYSYAFVGANDTNLASGVELNGLTQFFKKPDFECFTIITNKNKYKCNKFSIYLSDLIREKLEKEPLLKQYEYDFDDENKEFQKICDLFNFNPIEITKNNMDSLKEIAEDFQINCIIDEINKYINNSEKVAQSIDDQQTIIDSIDELFDWIYNIRDLTVNSVKSHILNSFWIETDENVQELVAFILEAVKTDILLHPYLADLLIELDEEASENNSLDILIPFIVDKLMDFLKQVQNNNCSYNSINYVQKSPSIYPFIYRLYKKGIIQKEQLFEKLKKYNFNDDNINAWFLPILVEMDKKIIDFILRIQKSSINNNAYYDFIRLYLPDKIDLYEKMLDSGEPDDALTKALRNDDVDTLQLIVSRSANNSKFQFVPFNIYDSFMQQGNNFNTYSSSINFKYTRFRYLNYAAAFGSVKCFKYLILNHDSIDEKTFEFAVYGGNNEIIKIVDQNSSSLTATANSKFGGAGFGKTSSICGWNIGCSALSNAITKHRNNLFDWIFEKNAESYINAFHQLAVIASNSGNAHALVEIIDRGFDISNNIEILHDIARNGFYRLSLFLSTIKSQNKKNIKTHSFSSYNYMDGISNRSVIHSSNNYNLNLFAVYFGNLSIFKLFMKDFSQTDIEELICFSVEKNYMSIIDYFFNCLYSGEIKFQENYLYKILCSSLKRKSDKLFKYLLEKFKTINPTFIITTSFYMRLLQNACKYDNFEGVKMITEIILNQQKSEDKKEDFSQAFNSAALAKANDLCQYFIDKKVNIIYDKIIPQSKLNVKIFSFIMSKISPNLKELFLRSIDQAIKEENKELIEYLFQQNARSDFALIRAVHTHDIDIVNLVLKYNKTPFFINQIFSIGTALLNAVLQEDLCIVKRLLSIPGIDPSLFNKRSTYPLIAAIEKNNIDIINAILDFYGDDIKYQKKQLDKAVKIVFNLYSSVSSKKDPRCIEVIKRILDIKYIDVNYIYRNPLNDQIRDEEYEINQSVNYSEDEENENNIDNIDMNADDENHHHHRHHHKKKSKQNNKFTFMLCACINNDIEMVERLLKIETIDVNQYSFETGDSPLIVSVREKHFDIVKLLIDFPSTNINHRNYQRQTALTIAAKNNSMNIINLLIENERFNADESQFNLAFYIANNEISKQMISSKFLDINYQYDRLKNQNLTSQIHLLTYQNNAMTKLTKASRTNDIELIDLIINHPSFDKNKSQIEKAIEFSIENRNIEIFVKLMKIVDEDVNLCNSTGSSLLVHAVHFSNGDAIDYILKNDKFDSKGSNILKGFVDIYAFLDGNRTFFDLFDITDDIKSNERDRYGSISEDIEFEEIEREGEGEEEEEEEEETTTNGSSPIEMMKKLYEYDQQHEKIIDLNKLLPNGETFFSIILFPIHNIGQIIDFLLEQGADPNQPDSSKIYPLEKAIILNSYEFVISLINSNKIDYSIRIPMKNNFNNNICSMNIKYSNNEKYTTYLHIASQCYCKEIISVFLERELIDINTTDDFGNTPLMNLCIYGTEKTFTCFNDFFGKENLDFLHKNKEGIDALGLLKSRQIQHETNETITDRTEYLNKLKETAEMIFN